MIIPATYSIEKLHEISEPLGNRGDRKIIEKVLYAFTLLEQLRMAGLNFVFKGGTSLLLLYRQSPRRFSIDIDIIADIAEADLLPYLDRVLTYGSFTRYVSDNERKHSKDAPVGHYKFYFNSAVGTMAVTGEEPILLDVLYTANPYPALRTEPINHPWLITDDNPTFVDVPEIESITGDKLTAFAPNTTGILYEKNRPVEVIKQLFDIGFLYNDVKQVQIVRDAYIKVATEEIAFRKLSISWRDSLEDAIATCVILSEREAKSNEFQFLSKGVKNIVNFILTRFHIEEAIICAAKAACLASVLLSGGNTLPQYTGPAQVQSFIITNALFEKLNKLKRALPEAFYYWYEVSLIY